MYSGLCIKRLRVFKEIKQETVAKRLGITQQAYSKLENLDIIPDNRLAKILDALNSSVKELEAINQLYPPPRQKNKRVLTPKFNLS